MTLEELEAAFCDQDCVVGQSASHLFVDATFIVRTRADLRRVIEANNVRTAPPAAEPGKG